MMMSRIFFLHGNFCASHPWEVILAMLTVTMYVTTTEHHYTITHKIITPGINKKHCNVSCTIYNEDGMTIDIIAMTLIRCMAVIFSYYQFCSVRKLKSKYILGVAAFFTVFSSFIFTSTVLNLLQLRIADLNDALIFFLLLTDLSKATLLAQCVLSASTQEEVKKNISKGMEILGPKITLDTVVETLLIGVGTLSGVQKLEMLSYFACLSVIINYIVFMTFYPACLSLLLELKRTKNIYAKNEWFTMDLNEEDQKSNPVVQRVKLIMSIGLLLVHAQSRLNITEHKVDEDRTFNNNSQFKNSSQSKTELLNDYVPRLFTISTEQVIILSLLLILMVKFVFFNNDKKELKGQQRPFNSTCQRIPNNNIVTSYTSATGNMFFGRSKSLFLFSNEQQTVDNSTTKSRHDKCTQTDDQTNESSYYNNKNSIQLNGNQMATSHQCRSIDECLQICSDPEIGAKALTNDEIIQLVTGKHIALHQIEKVIKDARRGVEIRRTILNRDGRLNGALYDLPYEHYDYSKVMDVCCENVIGYMPVPIGYAGPLLLDGHRIFVPMATTEGCLVASTNRGCRVLTACGITSHLVKDGMTRAPVLRFPSVTMATDAMKWLETDENFETVKAQFDSSSRFARLTKLTVKIAGRLLYIRFQAKTGDAMGMNMISKGTELALKIINDIFPHMEILSLSGNVCTDKKAAAINWIDGRGKSVVCEAIIPGETVASVLKTNVKAMIDLNVSKNMIGSAMAGCIGGGFNAHAANIVTAIFIATGQDPAQNVCSSNCMTLMEPWGDQDQDLYVSCTMPSIEVGTVGGGTVLAAQGACLNMLQVKGAHHVSPGENASQLARIICATVLAGELSLMGALAAGHLVRSHLRYNRSANTLPLETSCLKS